MNDDFPALSRAGFETLITLLPGGYAGRISLNPFKAADYNYDGDHISTKMIDRLVEDGYLEPSPPPPHRAMYFVVTEQARALCCPDCRGSGHAWTDDEAENCSRCSGRRLIAPRTETTPPYTIPVKKERRSRAQPPRVFTPRDPSPREPGYYWLALDNSSEFLEDRSFLVEVTDRADEYGGRDTRIRFFGDRFYDIIVDGFGDLHEHSIHKISAASSIGGLMPATSYLGEHRLNWLDRVYQPFLPEIKPYEPA